MKVRRRPISRMRVMARRQRVDVAYGAVVLVMLAIIGLDASQHPSLQVARRSAVDSFMPVAHAVVAPVVALADMAFDLKSLANLQTENARLAQLNQQLLSWRDTAYSLRQQNEALRSLVNAAPQPTPHFISAPIIGAARSGFQHNLVVGAGSAAMVRSGHVAISAQGVLGRVTEVGQNTARVMLLNDYNSRLPIMLQRTGLQAIVAGDNSPQLVLRFVGAGDDVRVGDRVVSAAVGGFVPAGVPVGVVTGFSNGAWRVAPVARPETSPWVQLIDLPSTP